MIGQFSKYCQLKTNEITTHGFILFPLQERMKGYKLYGAVYIILSFVVSWRNQVFQGPSIKHDGTFFDTILMSSLFYTYLSSLFPHYLTQSRKNLRRYPGFNPIAFTFSENSNYWLRQNIAGHCQQTFCIQNFVDNIKLCFAFTPFPPNI